MKLVSPKDRLFDKKGVRGVLGSPYAVARKCLMEHVSITVLKTRLILV